MHNMLRRPTHERGQSLVEIALVMPIFIVLIMGIVDFGLALRSYVTVTNSVREGARYAIVCPSTTSDSPIADRVQSSSNGLVAAANVTVTWQTSSQRCKSGDSVKVEGFTDYSYITPLASFLPGPLRLKSSTTMRAE